MQQMWKLFPWKFFSKKPFLLQEFVEISNICGVAPLLPC